MMPPSSVGPSTSPAQNPSPKAEDNNPLYELLTVEDVAALLKVNKTWVYEHTRARGGARVERLPHIQIGKYKRFDPQAVREFLQRRSKNR